MVTSWPALRSRVLTPWPHLPSPIVLTPWPPLPSGEGELTTSPLSGTERGTGGEDRIAERGPEGKDARRGQGVRTAAWRGEMRKATTTAIVESRCLARC